MKKSTRIMLVENDEVVADLLAESLRDMGFDVCAVESTESGAILSAEVFRPDLMIVDAQLGAGSGISAVTRILAMQSIPHLFVTGGSGGLSGIGKDVVVMEKPFSVTELKNAIDAVLSKS